MTLAPDQLRSLEREGYVVVPEALDRAWLGRLLLAFEHAPRQADGTQHVRVDEHTPELDAWRALETHPAIRTAAELVLGRPYHAGAHGRNPLPGFGQQGLHADAPPRTAGAPWSVLTAIWMLDDFTVDNGATRIVPGSHQLLRPLPKPLAQPLARHPEELIVEGRAGSVLIMNGHLWHSGRRNDSTAPRRAVQLVILAADAAFSPP